MHVAVFVPTGEVDEIELHGLAVRGLSGHHARAVAGVAVVNQGQVIAVEVKHRDRMVVLGWVEGCAGGLHFVHDCVAARGDAQGDVHWAIVSHALHWRIGGDLPFPLSSETLDGAEGGLRGENRGGRDS